MKKTPLVFEFWCMIVGVTVQLSSRSIFSAARPP